MISLIKCSILCIHVSILLNITLIHSLPNVTNFKKHLEKINHCESWQFKCTNGQCIANAFVCDGLKDCKDASDETYDQCKKKSLPKCDELHFQCQYGACIEKQYQCDGIKHCVDGSDESSHVCNSRNDKSNKIRRRRDANNSCAAPASSIDQTVDFVCGRNRSRACPHSNGYFPELTVATVTCNADYYREDNSSSSVHFCYKNQWLPPITKCLKKCDKLNPVNLILQCYHGGLSMDNCDSNSVLLADTKIRPSCKSSYKYDIPPSHFEIRCNKDGRWNNILPPCVPECGKPFVPAQTLISGGKLEPIGGSPWHVAIFNKDKLLICGGTIISEYLVISAAHCFSKGNGDCEDVNCADNYEIVVGKYTNNYSVTDNEFQRTMKIKEIRFPQNGYHGIRTRYAADIAILILTQPVPISPVVMPACLHWDNMKNDKQLLEGDIGKVAGWGRTESGDLSTVLKSVDLPFITYKQCLEMVDKDFLSFVTIDKFCAGLGTRTGATLMDGDSGGGLLFEEGGLFYLRGVVSVKQYSSDAVTLFTDLNKYASLIMSVTHSTVEQNSDINQKEDKHQLIAETVNYLKSHEYSAAEQKLSHTDPDTYYEIVHEAYINQTSGFDLLLNFSDSIENMEDKFKVCKCLYNEIISSNLNNISKLSQFSKAVKKHILNGSSQFLATEQLYQDLNNATIEAAIGPISLAFINDDSWSTIKQLSSDIKDECLECTLKIYTSVVDIVWNKVTIEHLLTRARRQLKYIEEMVAIHLEATNKLENIGALNTSSAITLAFYMNLTMNSPNYSTVKENLRSLYGEATKKLFHYHPNLKEAIIKPTVELISSAFENDNLWSTVKQLGADIAEECPECTVKIYSSVVDRVWNISDKLSIAVLQTSVNFQTSLDNQTVTLQQQIDKKAREKLVEFVQSSNNNLKRELENLQKKIDEKEKEEAKRQLPDEIVRDIKSQRFSEAIQKLQQTDAGTYMYVVHEVYNNQVGNFDLLLSFGDSINDMENRFRIYNALYNEMKVNSHHDIWKLFRLSRSIKNQTLDGASAATAAQSLYDTLWNVIDAEAIIPITASILNNKPMINLGNERCFEYMHIIYKNVMEKLWNKLSVVDIFARVRNELKSVDAQIAFQVAVFRVLQYKSQIQTNSTITLARQMKSTMEDANYQFISSEIRSKHEEIKKELPLSVKNIVFSTAVCIKNREFQEFLFADISSYQYDRARRRVFTWIPVQNREALENKKWVVLFVDALRIRLLHHHFDEYLYSEYGVSVKPYNEDRNYVFTWQPGAHNHQTDNSNATEDTWNIEVKGDALRLRNHYTNEYLYADSCLKYGNDRRQVFMHKSGEGNVNEWVIYDCTND